MSHLGKDYSLLLNKFFNSLKDTKTQAVSSLVAFMTSFTLFFILSGPVTNFLKRRIPFEVSFIQTAPSEILVNAVKIAFLGAMFVSIPVILYHIIKSNTQKITPQQKFKLKKFALASYLVTVISILFSCFAFIPVQLFLLLGLNMDLASINLNISDYISFCMGSILISGLLFNIPLVYFLVRKKSFFSHAELCTVGKYMPAVSLISAFVILASPELLSIVVLSGVIYLFYLAVLFVSKNTKF